VKGVFGLGREGYLSRRGYARERRTGKRRIKGEEG
jgi:hypothetical protein